MLGEQRPTALRCSKLVDVVFNGTDTRKPLGLAEVTITFADCEAELGTEYHEVTIQRRVYRDGSGEYFLNKQPCRLKDIQHLLMGTGIGTSSYSVMAQGQIDAILSSKPEDRRAVFEEASGITKFKADRKEALRKIEQTEQNLLREADVLREMKRQIASLQRQVGKAQKYKELRDELRGLDIYVSKQRIHGFDQELEQNAANRRDIEQAINEATGVVVEAERSQQELHAQVRELEERLQTLASQQAAADNAYSRANEVIGVNAQRIEEYTQFADRDERDIADTKAQLEEIAMQAESLQQKTRLLTESLAATKDALAESEEAFARAQSDIDAKRNAVQHNAVQQRRHEIANTTLSGILVNDTEVSRDGKNETWPAGTKVTTSDRREILMAEIAASEDELRTLEVSTMSLSQQLTERRIATSQMEQELSFVGQQNESAQKRRDELQRSIEGRLEGIRRYRKAQGGVRRSPRSARGAQGRGGGLPRGDGGGAREQAEHVREDHGR